jgi:hypothetical protein
MEVQRDDVILDTTNGQRLLHNGPYVASEWPVSSAWHDR